MALKRKCAIISHQKNKYVIKGGRSSFTKNFFLTYVELKAKKNTTKDKYVLMILIR